MNIVASERSERMPAFPWRRHYALTLLVLVGICSWSDRQIFSIMLESIRKEFVLSDTQLGLLGGTAFGLFYVAVGLPVAWLADRTNRRNIVAVAVFLWSVMTAVSAAATGYGSLFLCRMGVGIGEAGGSAPSQSLVSDLYRPQQRALAMGVLYAYLPIGYLLSYSLGGWLNDTIGWRTAFVAFGIPGVALALLFRFTVREPDRGRFDSTAAHSLPAAASLARTVTSLLRLRAIRHVCVAGAAHGLAMFSVAVWLPAYFMRVHGISSTEVGARLAIIMGVGGLAGTLGGGRIADRIVSRTRNPAWYLWLCTAVLAVSIPFTVAVYCAHSGGPAFLLLIVPMVLNNMIIGPVVASVQGLVGVRQRAVAAALYLFLVNLISAGCGPLIIGAISDALHANFGSNSLRYSLLMAVPAATSWAAVHFYLAGRALRGEYPQSQLEL